jgi:hypothetical protein
VLAISTSLKAAGFPLGLAAAGLLLETSVVLGLIFTAACALAGLLIFVAVA